MDATTTAVDLTPILQAVIALVAAALGTIGTWAIGWLGQHNKVAANAVVQGELNTALSGAIQYGVALAQQRGTPLGSVDVHNQVLADAGNYLAAHFGSLLEHYDLTGAGLQQRLLAHLPAATAAASTTGAVADAAGAAVVAAVTQNGNTPAIAAVADAALAVAGAAAAGEQAAVKTISAL